MPDNVPLTQEERKLAVQAEVDPVYQLHGRRAPAPEPGERFDRYDERLITPLQKHSEAFDKLDYASLTGSARRPIREQILQDARHAADHPKTAPGELREIKRADSSGRIISTFVGDPNGWLGEFKLPKQYAKIRDPR